MNTSTSSLPEMINSSIVVLTKPSIRTFEQYEKRGGLRDALVYVVAAALIAGIVGFVFNLMGGIGTAVMGLLAGVIAPVVGFFVFAFAIYFMGRQQGGTGTQDEVFYTTALYVAPLLAVVGAISAVPILGCLLLPVTLALGIYQIYLGYLAARSSMNLDQTKAIITVVVAYLAQFLVGAIIAAVLAGLAFTAAGTTGG